MTLMSRNRSRSKNLIRAQTVIQLRRSQRPDLLLWTRPARFHSEPAGLESPAKSILWHAFRLLYTITELEDPFSSLHSDQVWFWTLIRLPLNTTKALNLHKFSPISACQYPLHPSVFGRVEEYSRYIFPLSRVLDVYINAPQ